MAILNEVFNGIFRIKINYLSVAFNRRHSTQVYVATPIVEDSDGIFVFPSVNDPDIVTPTPYPLFKVVRQIFTRAGDNYTAIGEKIIESVEVTKGVTGENEFLGIDGGNYSQPVASGVAIAASHTIWVFSAKNKRQFRMSFFDSASANPQRVPRVQAPTNDDGSMAWLFTKSPVVFTTRYGEALTRVSSLNTGYNRKLAVEYGRVQ
jgi:hypothetical protein